MAIVLANLAPWGITQNDVAPLQAKQTVWTAAFAKASNKQNRTSADVQAKNDARDEYQNLLRKFNAQWISNNTKVPDSERQRMGLTVRSESRSLAPVPSTRPVGTIDFGTRLRHSIRFSDEQSPTSRAKPDGVHGCEIWMKLGGEPPKSAKELQFKGVCTRSPFEIEFEGTDGGQTAYFWLRWVNTRGEQGPWSSPLSAMVVG
jgi:hypothetical protein